MKIIMLEIGKEAKLVEVENDYKSLQKLVGGLIEYVPIFLEGKPYYLVVNEEGKLIGLPNNRFIRYQADIKDIIVGNAFISSETENKDLTEFDLELINNHINLTDINIS